MLRRKPQTYKEWLNALNNSVRMEDILDAAVNAAKVAPDKKTAFDDATLILANMHKREMSKAVENPVLERTIQDKFNQITERLFKASFDKVLNHVITVEPNFDPQAVALKKADRAALGFLEPPKTKDGYGSLGFLN